MRRLFPLHLSAGIALLVGCVFSAPQSNSTVQLQRPFVVDDFESESSNSLGLWHGTGEKLIVQYGKGYADLFPTNADQNYHTLVSPDCLDLTDSADSLYLHVQFEGTDKFSVSLNQNNEECSQTVAPYPESWDTIEASRYAQDGHIYVPVSHFEINFERASSVSFHGFYTSQSVRFYRVEFVDKLPRKFHVPEKLPSGELVLKCKRPNSFAFGVDDGIPSLAQEVMEIFKDEDILVTFFTVGNALEEPGNNFTQVYTEMLKRGHQVALHTYTHPLMEGLQSTSKIGEEISKNIKALRNQLGIESRYFRPPFGNFGARTRQALASLIDDPYIVQWSVDIEDWLWANTNTPEKQVEAFQRDVDKGGNLVVMHYLTPATVKYFREVIGIAKRAGKDIMRVDQCMEDPDAPPLGEDSEDDEGESYE